ncbi:translation initiation factor eIF-2B subunit epsilon-like [Pyrus ussuriensis x Pyrus communis]|uniref:Translation initiation factor eIF-2B subunit epsilon-like n=1 Tax=Pyrus ussuriensis x Pyrus communis TaxID=2448454 RepID=A0A5N5HKF1_9ROSA|nr:translation initiation factor eIF-2B subunit epsilon-like [Pyrus ussuriensis x Pyrus communis]
MAYFGADEDAGALDVAVGEVSGDLKERWRWRSRKDSGLVPNVFVFFSAMEALKVAASLPCACNATTEQWRSQDFSGEGRT